MLEKIPPYQINEDGAVREWMHPFFSDNYHHRHQSHIYPVFPGIEVTRDSDPGLFKAFETAIRKRLEIGISEQTGWSLAHMACVYARMQDGNSALECLNLLSRSCIKNNFYTVHNDWRGMGIGVEMEWAPFQIDANMGWSAAIQEMLLFSVPGKIFVLPALPKAWKRGSVSGLVARGGITVSIDWNEDAVSVELLSATDQTIEFSVDGGEWKRIPDYKKETARYQDAARATMRKDKRVNIRMSERDFVHFQKTAMHEGLPYQTLISSILHKYINGRLVE